MVVLASVNFLSIILFIVALGLLVSIHELGHLITAKIFKVYCFEYSIGFGPKLFQKKGKGGETNYTIRAIPLGGYVSMFGEAETVPEGIEVPPERSLLNVKKWKRAIIMSAGIILNFVLGLTLFLTNTIFFPQYAASETSQLTINTNAKDGAILAYQAGLITGDKIIEVKTHYLPEGTTSLDYPEKTFAVDTYQDLWGENGALVTEMPKSEKDIMKLTFTWIKEVDIDKENPESFTHTFTLKSNLDSESEDVRYYWDQIGISNYIYSYRLGFGDAVKQAFKDFGEATVVIAEALGNLFIGKGFEQLGGPVAILTTSTQALDIGFGMYLWLWASISVNLALFNLLPFPGLDGWHLLVVVIEGITKKEIPSKVKNIVSFVGMIILFAFMGIIFLKDILYLF